MVAALKQCTLCSWVHLALSISVWNYKTRKKRVNKKWIRKWISEGLTHYLEKQLCNKCEIKYVESGHRDYFVIWEKIHKKYDLEVLKTMLFAQDIKISTEILKHVFRYEKDDILQMTFEDAKSRLKLLGL